MRVPLSWLSDYVDVDLAPEQLAERLTLLGMEVQKIERWGSEWRNVVVGELLSVERHPRADRLSLTTVTVGDGSEPLEIVCGATNIAPGQRVPVALPGAVLPGDRRIERTEKLGVVSNGMLCSADELELTSDADGILILPPEAPLGVGLEALYGDTVLDVDVKPNRGDALSLVGLAREVAAITGGAIRFPSTDPPEQTDPAAAADDLLAVDVQAPDLCARFVGRWVSGVRVGPAPDTVQMRLRAAGVRPVSNVVDASNYVMLELGKPIHAFDARAVAEDAGRRRIIVRRAAPGERIQTLDHVDRTLDPDTLVIADRTGPIGIAGIMGGAESEVGDSTTDVIVESAVFDPVTIRRTGQRYGLRSEASLRFEKGQEFRLARLGADRTARLIVEWSGGSVARGRVDSAPDEPGPSRIAFRPARVNRLLGTALATDEQRSVLARIGIDTEDAEPGTEITISGDPKPQTVASDGQALVAIVPTWRGDIAIEADVAEEVARIHGYERIPEILPHTPMPAYRHQPLELRDRLRETLAGAGLTEVVSHALVSPAMAERFRWESPFPQVAGGTPEGGRIVGVENPLSVDHSVLRQSVTGSLVDIVARNFRQGTSDVAVYEVGKGYGALEGSGNGTIEWWRLAIALTGNRRPASWNQRSEPFDVDDAKGIIELLCRRLGLDAPSYVRLQGEPLLHPGRSATVTATRDSATLLGGVVGELHPGLDAEWDLRGARLVVAELDVAGLAGGSAQAVLAAAPPRHPATERDLAVVVAEEQAAGAVAEAIRGAAGPMLERLGLFDVYRGAPLATGEKSLAFRLSFRAPDRSVPEAEIDAIVSTITQALSAEVAGRIRT